MKTKIYEYDANLWFDKNPKEHATFVGEIEEQPAIGKNVMINGLNYNIKANLGVQEPIWCAKQVNLDYSGNTSATPAPICPHCGYHDGDYWEWEFRQQDSFLDVKETERECLSCHKEFRVEQETSVHYSTTKK